jgi:lipopolysaccharide/colanic/teichoic acid biosynthesis glycosyltransferase
MAPRTRFGIAAKRAFDVIGAALGLILLSPLFLVLAGRVRKEVGTPVLFHQRRPGLHGELFTLHKFRTMTGAVGPDGKLLPDGERLTPFGRWLRATSLDELPELWNVLRGDMSLVGPRPLLVEYLELYTPRQARRQEVRPGITGWSQVHGRNDQSWPEKLELDVWYVEHRTFWLDLRILVRTLLVTLRREGVNLAGHDTTVPFTGEPDPGGYHPRPDGGSDGV